MPIGKEQDYEAQSDARTLVDAEGIKGDSKRFGKAMKHVAKTHKAHANLMKQAKDSQGSITNAEPGSEVEY